MALLGTAILPERRCYLEAFGVEVHVLNVQFLSELARQKGIDPEVGIPRPASTSTRALRHRGINSDRFPVTDESSYLERVNQLTDDNAKERLVAIYGVAKKARTYRSIFPRLGARSSRYRCRKAQAPSS